MSAHDDEVGWERRSLVEDRGYGVTGNHAGVDGQACGCCGQAEGGQAILQALLLGRVQRACWDFCIRECVDAGLPAVSTCRAVMRAPYQRASAAA